MKRSFQEIMVSGRTMQDVKVEVVRWMQAQEITSLEDREDFLKGRLGNAVVGLTAPKYFEIFLKPKGSGVLVRTEMWIGLYGAGQEFLKGAILGGVPRIAGWKVMEHLWAVLNAMSR